MGRLEARLRARRDAGGRAFVPYVTGGYPGVDARLLRGLADAGADAIEVGIPFSDPVMDGGVIQEASAEALRRRRPPADVLAQVREAPSTSPVAVMTYVNPIHARLGVGGFVEEADAGVAGLIVPDLPVDESDELEEALTARPGSTSCCSRRRDPRGPARRDRAPVTRLRVLRRDVRRDRRPRRARETAASGRGRAPPHTDLPLLVGVGIGTPAQAAEVCAFADGVVVGSALMPRILGWGPAKGRSSWRPRSGSAIPS